MENKLRNYAKLAIQVGINVEKGQELVINAPVNAITFTRLLVEEAYTAGVKDVLVLWYDEITNKTRFQMAPDEAFETYPAWRAEGLETIAKNGGAFLTVLTPNPDLMKDVDPARMQTWNRTAMTALKAYRHYTMNGLCSWNLLTIPSEAWASKVFPNDAPETAMDKLWAQVFSVTRSDQDDPVQAWKDHISFLKNRLELLNNKHFKELHFQSDTCDFTIQLPEDHIWVGGSIANAKGRDFVPNLPTEEVFTSNLKSGLNGWVKATRPLSYQGNLITDFSIWFEEGKIVKYEAASGEEALKSLIETDEGSRFIGEVALVPYDSPISNSNIIFYNTLYDENASCHLAIGNAYGMCLKGGEKMNEEQLAEAGLNRSLSHSDFMIGSADLSVIGTTRDGAEIQLFKNGNWA